MKWWMVITSEMREDFGLAGNELLIYALIAGFSQNRQGAFFGSLAYIQEVTGIRSKQTVINCLKSLQEKGLIEKREVSVEGVTRCIYTGPKNGPGVVQKLDGGSPKIGPNKYNDNGFNKLNPNNRKEGVRFQKPTIEDIRVYCIVRKNRVDPVAFFNYYESNGWKVGKNPMKDWKAAVRTWESREESRPRTESAMAAGFRLAEEWGLIPKKEGADEQ